ncbi:HEAT repeat domain-containing protein [Mariniblastus fucicola]|nr:HEAT repeat domain-containing protein [Mariniblastus fucicola]
MDSPKYASGLRQMVLCAAFFAAGVTSQVGHAQQRIWTDASGTYKLEAELVEVTETETGLQAELLKPDGTRMAIQISKLCEADAELAKNYYEDSIKGAEKVPPAESIPAESSTAEQPSEKDESGGSDNSEDAPKMQALAEESIVSRPLAAPVSMAIGKLDNRNTTDIKFNPATAIRLEREMPRDEKGRPTENPIYLVEVTEQQLAFLQGNIRTIVDKLRDPKVAIDEKRRAIDSLRTLWPQGRHPGLLNVLINTLSHDDKYLRLAAIDLLANHDSDQSLIYIFARIDDISFDVRWRTYEILTQLRDPRIIPELCERLDGADRAKVSSVLQVFGETSAPLVHEWVNDDHDEVTLLNVCQLLGNIGDKTSLDVLAKLNTHSSLLVRAQAKNSIKQIRNRMAKRASNQPQRR